MLKLEDKHIEKIESYIQYLDMTFTDEEVNEITAQIFKILIYERPLLKSCLNTPAERFLYESGIYKEVTAKRKKSEKNKRYQDKKRKEK